MTPSEEKFLCAVYREYESCFIGEEWTRPIFVDRVFRSKTPGKQWEMHYHPPPNSRLKSPEVINFYNIFGIIAVYNLRENGYLSFSLRFNPEDMKKLALYAKLR